MAKKKMIEIKLIKSDIGTKPKQAKTLKALGLTKINQVVKKPDNEAIRGMIATVNHLVEIL
ncbi:MAG: 50S ribosomal protein L30 [Bacilli bacterium]|jgi:large subunit ribosomal protein L30|nr:50S ribosomal protein L30 [Bacillota bacterium]NLM31968.1 50S ribosomal protein L30 [Acholeplasmataceae bacterium]HOA77957.1 50S ribosomal protein L30 [Bacilli bacterium]HPZ26731.1 50S ribosomal protein L30 [Bacilli bacterium]HQC89200.1 50S ribosomal protein L30 [Bacilli bacterium]